MELIDIFRREFKESKQANLFTHIRKDLYEDNKYLLDAIVYDRICAPLYNVDELIESYSGECKDDPLIYTMKVRKLWSCMPYDELKFLAEYLIRFAHTKFESYAKAFIQSNPKINDGITIDLRNLKFKNAKKSSVYYIKLHIMDVQSAKLGLFTAARMCLRYLWCDTVCRLEYYLSFDQFDKARDEDKKMKEVEKMLDNLEMSVREYYKHIG